MFYNIHGTLEHKESGFAVVDCGGIGFKLTIGAMTLGRLPDTGTKVKLYTYLSVREDALELFGFISQDELSAFKNLISVSGVGPKAAMGILSAMTPEKFAMAVITEDTRALSRAPGVGAKTAARIVLELRDKLAKEFDSAGTAKTEEIQTAVKGHLSEARDALVVLGYTRTEADAALRSIDPAEELEAIIKKALAKLMK
jgi:Holliday junction DNA helicase RuvA